MKLLTTVEAAKCLGVSARRVRVLLAEGRIKAMRVGGRWLIDEADLVYERKRPGPKIRLIIPEVDTSGKGGHHERPHCKKGQG